MGGRLSRKFRGRLWILSWVNLSRRRQSSHRPCRRNDAGIAELRECQAIQVRGDRPSCGVRVEPASSRMRFTLIVNCLTVMPNWTKVSSTGTPPNGAQACAKAMNARSSGDSGSH